MKMLYKLFPLYAFSFVLAFLLTVVFEKNLIPILKMNAKQPIYLDGPRWHSKKSGTPTMGGLGFIFAFACASLLSLAIIRFDLSGEKITAFFLILAYALSNALIGFIDDRQKLKKGKNEGGLKPIEKFSLQLLLAFIFLILKSYFLGKSTNIDFIFGEIELGLLYYPLTLFIMLGIINSVNLTDGIDGLASSVTFASAVSFFYITSEAFPECALISSTLIGVSVGFLCFNLHPAKIFMGDTGSLFFGSVLSGLAIMLDNPLLIIFVGGVFCIEGLSVTLQVLSYKLFKKRIFKMAPLHHHLEKCGFNENKICIIAILLSFIFALPAYVFFSF